MLSLYIQDTVQQRKSRDDTKHGSMELRHLEQLEKPASGAASAKGKFEDKGKSNGQKGQCFGRCGMKHDHEKMRESKGKGKVPWSSSPRRTP